jgi:hypothetical protein
MWTGHDDVELDYGREGIKGTRPEERKRKKKREEKN